MKSILTLGLSFVFSIALNVAFAQGALFTHQSGPSFKAKPRFKKSVKAKSQQASITGMEQEAARKEVLKKNKVNTNTAFSNEVFITLIEEQSSKPYAEVNYKKNYNPVNRKPAPGLRQHDRTKRKRQ